MNERLHFLFGTSSCLLWSTFSPFPHIRLTAEPVFRMCLNAVVVDLQNVLRFTGFENHSSTLQRSLLQDQNPVCGIRDFAPLDKQNVS